MLMACITAGLFGGGLMGRMMERTVGKAMEGAINQMGEQLRAAQSQANKIQKEAASAITANSEVRRHLGGSVQVADAVSQQNSTQTINGRTMQTVTPFSLSILLMLVIIGQGSVITLPL